MMPLYDYTNHLQVSGGSHPTWYIGVAVGITVVATFLIGYEVKRTFKKIQDRLDGQMSTNGSVSIPTEDYDDFDRDNDRIALVPMGQDEDETSVLYGSVIVRGLFNDVFSGRQRT